MLFKSLELRLQDSSTKLTKNPNKQLNNLSSRDFYAPKFAIDWRKKPELHKNPQHF